MPLDVLSGTILNAAAVAVGATVGLVAATPVSARLQESLTTGLGLFTLVLAVSMGFQVFTEPAARTGDALAVLGGILLGVTVGEWLRLHDRLEAVGAWFQRRLARDDRPSRVSEAFVTTSIVFCVGPLTILGSLDNGLRGDITLLAQRSPSSTASRAWRSRPRWVRGSISRSSRSSWSRAGSRGRFPAGRVLRPGHTPCAHLDRRDHAPGSGASTARAEAGPPRELPARAGAGAVAHPALRRGARGVPIAAGVP